MNHRQRRLTIAGRGALLALALLVAGAGAAIAGQLAGTAFIRERIALPPDAEFEAHLLDASAPGGPELRFASARKVPAGQSPFAFVIDYDSARVQPGQRYVVRATVTVRGQVRFAAEPPAAVRLDDADPPVQLVLVATGAALQSGTEPAYGPTPGLATGPFLNAPATSAALQAALGSLPATFAGELPGPAGTVRWQLDLMPDGRYQLRQVPTARRDPNRYDDTGLWSWERERQRLVLRGGRQETIYLELAGNGMLRKLDGEGRRLRRADNDLLQRVSAQQPAFAEQRLAVSGMFTSQADAARITLCTDGRSLPVAMEGDFRALQAAYRAARPQPGQALLVSAQGLITLRSPTEPGRPPVPTLVIERFENVWPGETCGQPQATSPLRGTYWKLVRLNGQPVLAAADRGREPHLIFDQAQVSGSGGCNRLTGPVELGGDRIAMKQIAATRMACSVGMEQESAFFDSLERAVRWRITGSHLELLDGAGRVLARFEAGALR